MPLHKKLLKLNAANIAVNIKKYKFRSIEMVKNIKYINKINNNNFKTFNLYYIFI